MSTSTLTSRIARNQLISLFCVFLITLSVVTAGINLTAQTAAAEPSGDDGTVVVNGDDYTNGTQNDTEVHPVRTGFERTEVSQLNILSNKETREKFWVIKRGSDDYIGYVTENNDGSVNAEDDITLFTSSDGKNWSDQGTVISTDYQLHDPTVVVQDGTYYLYAENGTAGDTLVIFTSSDGKNWTREGSFTNSHGPQSPVVKIIDGKFYLLYETFKSGSQPWYVRYATSTDGVNWTDQGTFYRPNDSDQIIPDDWFQGPDGKWYLYFHDNKNSENNTLKEGVAVADSKLGDYTFTGDVPAPNSSFNNIRESFTVVHDERGHWDGYQNKNEFWVYGSEITGNANGPIHLYKGDGVGGLSLPTAEEDGDVTEWSSDGNASVSTTGGKIGTYAVNVTTKGVSGYETVNHSLGTTVKPDKTVFSLKIPKPKNKDSWALKLRILSGGTAVTTIAFDKGGDPIAGIAPRNPSGTWTNAGGFTYDEYHRVTIDWDWADNDYDLIVDGEVREINQAFENSASGYDVLNGKYDYNSSGSSGMSIYTDAPTSEYSATSGNYTSEWHSFGTETGFEFYNGSESNGGSITWEFRSSSDGTADTASKWYQNISKVPDGSHLQVRASLSGSQYESPTASSYRVIQTTNAGTVIAGIVKTQNGDAVPNATVRIMGVDKTNLDVNPSKYEEKADELLAEAENVTPPDWRPHLQLTGSDGLYAKNDTNYVAVHTKSDWSVRGRDVGGNTVSLNDDLVELGTPHVQVGADETVILSVWDPSREAILEDGVDSDLPGRTVPEERTIVIEQLGPAGDVTDRSTRNTSELVEITTAANVGSKTHYAVQLGIGKGFYRVYPEGSPEKAVVFAKGDPQSMIKTWETDLEDEAGEASSKAQRLRDLIQDQQKLQSWTVQTDENGKWSKSRPPEYITVAVTAYKGPYDKMQKSPTNATVQDIRAFYETAQYNGSVVIAPSPKKVSPPEQGVTITVLEQTTAPRTNVNVSAKLEDLLQEYLENRSLTGVSGAVQQALEDYQRSDLEETYQQLRGSVGSNDRLWDRYTDLLEKQGLEPTDTPPSDIPRDELETRVNLLEQTWYETGSSMAVEETTTDVGQETISAAMQVGEQVDLDDVTVIAHYSNGTSRPVNETYLSVDSGVTDFGGSTIAVEDYPINQSDPAAVTFEFRVANENGVAKGRETIQNPHSNATPPALKTISLSTLEPGPDETVGIEVIPAEDSTFDAVTNVTVYGPDNTEIPTDAIEGGTETGFKTAGQGNYRIVIEMATADSDETFVEVVRLEAGDINRNANPSVRLIDTQGGVVPMVGDGLQEAEVRTTARGDVTVAPVVTDDITGLDLFVQSATTKESDITVRLLKPDGSSYRKSVGVRIHTTKLSDDAYVYRGEQPVTSDGSAAGSREDQADQTLIDTYTKSNGEVTITTIENPGAIQQAVWIYRTQSPIQPLVLLPELPSLPGPDAPLGASAGVAVVAGAGALARRRR